MSEHNEPNATSQPARQRYVAPELREFGSLSDLTRALSTKTSRPIDTATKGTKNRSV